MRRVPLRVDLRGAPVYLEDVANIALGPEMQRGLVELDGDGEVVGGVVVMRSGENALAVIGAVKERLAELEQGLPEGVEVVVTYDRSELILAAISTLRRTLLEELAIVSFVIFVFLLHVRSALVAIITLPLGILFAFIAMRSLGLGSNIMSLGGIAIAIGAMVDAAIVMIENAHKRLEHLPHDATQAERSATIIHACKEVGPALFFSLLIITVSFLPVFTLEGQEGRMFSPLAFTKTFAMAGAALLSVTLVPVLMGLFIRGRILPEARNPVNRFLMWLYRPLIALVMRWKRVVLPVELKPIRAARSMRGPAW